MERYFYYGKDTSKEYPVSIDKLPAKPMFIMTRQMVAEELENIPFYKNLAFHHLVQQTSDIERKLKEPEFCDLLEYINSVPLILNKLKGSNVFQSSKTRSRTSMRL